SMDTIIIERTLSSTTYQTGDANYSKLVGDVVIRHGTDYLYCDTAFVRIETKSMEAFGSVRIVQPGGTEATSDYLRYNDKVAFLSGNVSLTDGKSNLWCEELTYNLTTKVGVYDKNGTLQDGATVVSSREGT